MRKGLTVALAMALTVAPVASLSAGWKVMTHGVPVAVAKSSMTVTPAVDWNRWSARPSKKGELWTLDGLALNELAFFAGVTEGEALFRERDKKNKPLPKFKSKMLAPDVVQMFEGSMRIVLDTALFEIDTVEPAKLSGHDGVRFTYHYTVKADELRRLGEARAAVIGGKLYLVNFQAPAIHYYDANIAEVRAMMDSVKI
ncbi:hypothetical protein FHS96_000247 [Sphingomonas zeicaulis]|uniref:hypothetical protein n=1 Tax=Sphingomonas zeicaulis TaxID=1632740 RepID=UPI003D1D77FA